MITSESFMLVGTSATNYENTDTSSPWPPSPAEEGGGKGIWGIPPDPHQRGSASLDSLLFSMGDSQGAKPLWRGLGVPPSLPPNPPKNGGQRDSASLGSLLFSMGDSQGAKPLWRGLGGVPQPPSQFPQVPSFADAELCDCVGQEWGTKGVERTIFVATAKEIWAKGELLAPKRRLGY